MPNTIIVKVKEIKHYWNDDPKPNDPIWIDTYEDVPYYDCYSDTLIITRSYASRLKEGTKLEVYTDYTSKRTLESFHTHPLNHGAVKIIEEQSTEIVPISSSSSNTIVSASSAGILPPAAVQQVSTIAQSLAQEVDRSGGRHEFEYKIEIRHPDGSSASHSLIARPSKYYNN